MMEWLIREKKPLKLTHLIKPSGYNEKLIKTTRSDVIMELAHLASVETGLDPVRLFKAVWEREQIMGTALGSGIAVPHARLIEINSPVIIAGYSQKGIDFNAMDGAPVKMIFLLLTPQRDQGLNSRFWPIYRGFSPIQIFVNRLSTLKITSLSWKRLNRSR